MKNYTVFIFVVILIFSGATWSEVIQITKETVPLVYASKQEQYKIDDELLKAYSKKYFRARNEFDRHEIKQNLLPIVEKKIGVYKISSMFLIKMGTKVKEYNFSTGVFPLNLSNSTIIEIDDYVVIIQNIESMLELRVPFEQAKELSSSITMNNRKVILEVEGSLVAAEEKLIKGREADLMPRSYKGRLRKVITIKAKNVVVKFRNGDKFMRLKI